MTFVPDAARSARVRSRCHALLDARRRSIALAQARTRVWKRVLRPALVGGFCIFYFGVLLWDVFGASDPRPFGATRPVARLLDGGSAASPGDGR
jgi:hypothetical protein